MLSKKHEIIFLIFIFLCSLFESTVVVLSDENIELPVQIRFIRAYGGNDETEPPIIVESSGGDMESPVGSRFITLEFDVQSSVTPNLYARFVHCSAVWDENENVFLNDMIYSRTSNIEWSPAPISSGHYSYRGRIQVPNTQVKFKYAGNWKMKLYEYYNDSIPLAETRFFVVKPKANCILNIYGDFYEPSYPFISPSAVNLQATVYADQKLFDNQFHTVAFYKNNRWLEPYYASSNENVNSNNSIYRYYFPVMAGGFATAGKIFRISGLPVENEYRILNLTNLAAYPETRNVVRKPLSDYRRRGGYWEGDDDGAMITTYVADYNDTYVNMEFVLSPDNWITIDEVYVVGSFNNWKADKEWQMYYDAENRNYKCRHLIRRARHNYLYATGKYNISTGEVEKISYDEYEGNASSNEHTYFAFVYYREFDYGGYDSIIGIGAATIFGTLRR
jgi:hypothetical protein